MPSLHKEFDFDPEFLSIPDGLIARIAKYYDGLQRIIVEKKSGTRSWGKVNGFDLELDVSGRPKDVDDNAIAQMVVAIAKSDVEENGEDGTYRAAFVRMIGGKLDRKTFSFKQGLDDGSTAPAFDQSDSDPHALAIAAMQNMSTLVTTLMSHTEAQNARLLAMSELSTHGTQQLLESHATMMGQFHDGLKMTADALKYTSDVDRQLEETRQRGKIQEKGLEMLGNIAPLAALQIAASLKEKGLNIPIPMMSKMFGGQAPTSMEPPKRRSRRPRPGAPTSQEDAPTSPEDAPTSGSSSPSTSSDEPTSESPLEDMDPNEIEHPVTMFAHAIRDSIDHAQWFALSDALTKRQMGWLRHAMESEVDEETIEGVIGLQNEIAAKPNVLPKLMEILEGQQAEEIVNLLGIVSQMQDPTNEKADPENGAGDDGGDE